MSGDKKRKLPEGWSLASLGDISLVTLIMGQSPPGETYNKNGTGLPFFQGKADFGNIYPEPSVWCSAPNRLAESNDILMSVRAPVGPTNIAREKCCIGRGIAAIRCKDGLSYKYLIWVLRNFEKKISSEGAGSIFDAIGKDEIKAIEFPIPPTPNDQNIIAFNIEHKMAQVEKMRGAALRQKEAIAAMQGAILSEIFPYKGGDKLPEGWKLMKLKQLGFLSQGGTPSTDIPEFWNGNFPFITGADVTELFVSNARSYLTEKGLDSGKTQRCENGDLLIVSRTRVGRIGIAAKTLGVSQDVSVLKVNRSYDTKYLAIFLNSISKELEGACQGATIKGLTRGYIENINIPLPPSLSDQIAIASALERKMSELEKARLAAEKQLDAIEALPGAILREVFDFEEEYSGSQKE